MRDIIVKKTNAENTVAGSVYKDKHVFLPTSVIYKFLWITFYIDECPT